MRITDSLRVFRTGGRKSGIIDQFPDRGRDRVGKDTVFRRMGRRRARGLLFDNGRLFDFRLRAERSFRGFLHSS